LLNAVAKRVVQEKRKRARAVMVNVFAFSAVDHEFFYWSGFNQAI